MADSNGSSALDTRSRFVQIYARLKSELLEDPAFDFTDDSRQWIDRMLDYNVPGGKLNRGISVVDSYKLLKEGKQLTDDEFFYASALGWCVEWLQAYFLVLDDIMDDSHTRRGQACWFRVPKRMGGIYSVPVLSDVLLAAQVLFLGEINIAVPELLD